MFLGYAFGYKGVICYSISQNMLWISRHVIHDETTFPFLSSYPSVSSPLDPTTFFHSLSPLTTLPTLMLFDPLSGGPTTLAGGNETDVANADANSFEHNVSVSVSINANSVTTNVDNSENSKHSASVSNVVPIADNESNDSSVGVFCLDTNNTQNPEVTDLIDAHIEAHESTVMADVVLEDNYTGGLSMNEMNVLQFGGDMDTGNLPQELDFIVHQDYNAHVK